MKPAQTYIRGGIETIFADLNTPNGIITVGLVYNNTPNGIIIVGLVYKLSVDINVENFSTALETIIFSLDPHNKTYIYHGDFDINLLAGLQ